MDVPTRRPLVTRTSVVSTKWQRQMLGWSGLRGNGDKDVGWEERGRSWRGRRVMGRFAFSMREMIAHLASEGNDLVERGSCTAQEGEE